MKPTIDFSDLCAAPRYTLEADTEDDQDLAVDIHYEGATGKWSATLDDPRLNHPPIDRDGVALCGVLHEVANEVERRGLYDSDRFDPNLTEQAKRTKKCQYCDGRFFFAETINGKWMAVDFESVPVTLLGSTRGYQLHAVNGGARSPQVTPLTGRHHGQGWIAHQNVCGATPTGPDSPILRQRWETNRGATVQQTTDALRDLAHTASLLREN